MMDATPATPVVERQLPLVFLGTHDDPMCADASPFPNDGDADDVLGPGLPGYAPFLSH
jgi:hypothetical protein